MFVWMHASMLVMAEMLEDVVGTNAEAVLGSPQECHREA
jgi:hypothetical protein